MTSIKEKLLKIKDNIHSVEVAGMKLHFKHLKASDNKIISEFKNEDVNIVAFIIALCEEDGTSVFTMEEIEDVKQLNRKMVNIVSNAAMMGDEKKPLGI